MINNKKDKLDNNDTTIKFQKNFSFHDKKHEKKLHKIKMYKKMITKEINKKFYNDENYSNKKCTLHIKLSPDGQLENIKSFKGDFELCQAAISATKFARLPFPPDSEIYDMFQNIILNFHPK